MGFWRFWQERLPPTVWKPKPLPHLWMHHALALIAVAWRADRRKGALSIALAGWGFVIGILLFSGSLYVLGVSGSRSLVWLTPLGGVSFLGGWAALVVDVLVKLQKAA